MSSEYELFYLGERGTLVGGYMVTDILEKWTDLELENCHTYVQYAFPTLCQSKAQANATKGPLTLAVAKQMTINARIMARYDRMVSKMLLFWGMERRFSDSGKLEGIDIIDHNRFQSKFGRVDHNQLRMTRMLASLECLGMEELAECLRGVLQRNVRGQQEAKSYWGIVEEDDLLAAMMASRLCLDA